MAVKIRMSRIGKKGHPFYRIGVYDSRTRRNGRCLENLGWVDPFVDIPEKHLSIDLERTKYWLGVGARPTPKTAILLKKAGIVLAGK